MRGCCRYLRLAAPRADHRLAVPRGGNGVGFVDARARPDDCFERYRAFQLERLSGHGCLLRTDSHRPRAGEGGVRTIGGWLIFQQVIRQRQSRERVAITAMVLYTKYTLDQSGAARDNSGAKQRNPPEPQSIGCRAMEDLTSDGEGEGELEGQAPADASEGSPLMSRTLDRRV